MKKATVLCPICGSVHESVVLDAPPAPIGIIRQTESEATWPKIKQEISAGNAASALSVGDKIRTDLKNGKTVYFVVAAIDPYAENEVAFVMEDCLDGIRLPMNDTWTNEGGWSKSLMRKKLNAEILDMLPDDLAAIIKPRKIVQEIRGETFTSEDKLWIPSYTEVFEEILESDVGDVHFPLFDSSRSRVKNNERCAYWWWLRSARGSNDFNYVVSNGGNGNTSAYNTGGVTVGFLL